MANQALVVSLARVTGNRVGADLRPSDPELEWHEGLKRVPSTLMYRRRECQPQGFGQVKHHRPTASCGDRHRGRHRVGKPSSIRVPAVNRVPV
jgi:hypothetical protein